MVISGLCVGNIIQRAIWKLNLAENTRIRRPDVEAIALVLTGQL